MRGVQEGEGTDVGEVHGDDPGLAHTAFADGVAEALEGERDAYLPIESLKQQATALLVYGQRVGGPIGSLLEVAGEAVEVAVMLYEAEYGEFANGPAPSYEDDL